MNNEHSITNISWNVNEPIQHDILKIFNFFCLFFLFARSQFGPLCRPARAAFAGSVTRIDL